MPMKNGVSVFTDEELQYQTFDNWTSIIVATAAGKMIAFQTWDERLTDINATFKKELDYGQGIKNITLEALSPILDEVSGNYSVLVFNDSGMNYTTYVHIDRFIKPLDGINSTITFELTLIASEGKFPQCP